MWFGRKAVIAPVGRGRRTKVQWRQGGQGQKIKQRALGEVGGEGWMMPFHAKKAPPSSAGWPRSSLDVEKAAAAATEHSEGDSPALVEATPRSFQIETSTKNGNEDCDE